MIQYRYGTNVGFELNNANIVVGEPVIASDTPRHVIGTGDGTYMEVGTLHAIARRYISTSHNYDTGDICSHDGVFYVCKYPTSGAWNASAWEEITLGGYFADLLRSATEQIGV